MCAGSMTNRSSAPASFEQSITQAGATNRCTGKLSVNPSEKSLPVTQCAGASKCVPVCSPHEILFQYQPGPR